ncbi:MAG: OsmC family protein [candidate division Zixibacteria bacterium]|nr:OsmC family protein [candidate division Zixibacteria bacterium]
MEALCINVSGIVFIGKADSNHWVTMDGAPEFRGYKAGTSPAELVLIGLGGCTGMDVASILQKRRIKYDRFEIKLKADRAVEHPKLFTNFELEYLIYGHGISQSAVEEAINLSQEKYCSVSATLKKAAPVKWTCKIIEN